MTTEPLVPRRLEAALRPDFPAFPDGDGHAIVRRVPD